MSRFAAGYARVIVLMLLIAGASAAHAEEAPANPPAGEAAAQPQAQPPTAGPAEGTKPAPAAGGEAAPEGQPAKGAAKPDLKPGPALEVAGIGSLEMLPRDYDATLRFYVEVLGFREADASGGEGERRCTLTSGPVRLSLREQPGKPILPKRPPWLGVHPALLSEVAAEAAGLKEPRGVVVDDLVPQGPAGIAGIMKGDIILEVEGKATPSPSELTNTIRGFAAGKKVLVTLWREGKKRDVPVQLPESPFPEQLGPVAVRLEVRDLDGYYREVLKRGIRVYAEPRDSEEGGRVLEMVDPNDLLIVLEQPRPRPAKPAPAGGEGQEKPAAPAPAPEPQKE